MIRLAPPVSSIVAGTLAFLVGFWLVLMPQVNIIGQSAADLAELRSQSASLSGPITMADTAVANEDLKKKLQVLLPTEDKQYDLSIQVTALAEAAGVTLASLSISPPGGAAPSSGPKTTLPDETATTVGAAKIPMTITVSSTSYAGLHAFVKTLPTLDRQIILDSVSFATAATTDASSATPSAARITATVGAFAYFLPATAK